MRTVPALLAVLVLTGCGAAATTAAPASGHSPQAAAPSCRSQYEAWKHGPARQAGKGLVASLKGVESASNAMDLPKLTAALERAGRSASRLAAAPPPRCADPKGYYGQMLAHVTAAGDNADSAKGLAALMLAEVPLKSFGAAEKRLNAELGKTVGKHR